MTIVIPDWLLWFLAGFVSFPVALALGWFVWETAMAWIEDDRRYRENLRKIRSRP